MGMPKSHVAGERKWTVSVDPHLESTTVKSEIVATFFLWSILTWSQRPPKRENGRLASWVDPHLESTTAEGRLIGKSLAAQLQNLNREVAWSTVMLRSESAQLRWC